MTTLVKNIASKELVYIHKGASVEKANELMAEHRIRHLPVVDELNGIIGVVSARDLKNIPVPQRTQVVTVMSSPVEFFDQDVSLRTVILHMLEKKISCVLVADKENGAIGIVTTDDMLWHLAHLLKDEKNQRKSFSSVIGLQTIGQLANQLSTMGI